MSHVDARPAAGTGSGSGGAQEGLRCADCKRRLRRPSPTGFGPVCARRRGLTQPASTTPAATAAPVAAIPGQVELPLADHQPTLWSPT